MNSITIKDVPLPSSELSPNSRKHWRAKADRTKEQRGISKLCGMSSVAQLQNWQAYQFPWSKVVASVVWFRGSARKIDRDNALASLKSTFDGLVDAGILEDDWELIPLPIEFDLDRKNPRLEITLTKQQDGVCPMCGKEE